MPKGKSTKGRKAKKEVVLSLEDVMMNCRNIMRGKASNEKQRDIILTLLFIKFLNEKFENQQKVLRQYEFDWELAENSEDDVRVDILHNPAFYEKDGAYYLDESCRWNLILNSEAKNLPLLLDEMVSSFNRMERLRDTLPPKIFTDSRIDGKVFKQLAEEIDKIDNKRFQEKDLIGRVYEYFLQAFSINAEKEEGEFYTPHSIVELMASLTEPWDGVIYDPCCGSGGMFVQAVKFVESHGGDASTMRVYGQESNPDTWRLAKMNLAIRGISFELGESHASTFQDDQHPDLSTDYILANPPFNLKKWRAERELETDSRWRGYSVPPASNANYAWILHMLSKLKPGSGVAGFLLANGALNDSDTYDIRKQLIENDKVEAIIVLPRDMFYSTDISVTLWILNNNKKTREWHGRKLRNRQGEILFVDLRTWNSNIYEKKYVELLPAQIAIVSDIYHNWQMDGCDSANYAKPELYRSVNLQEIRDNDYALMPSRYVEFVDHDREIDVNAVLDESHNRCVDLVDRQIANGNDLKKALNDISGITGGCKYVALKNLIHLEERVNVEALEYPIMGINREKEFMPTVAAQSGLSREKYKIISKGQFVYSGMQTGRDVCIRIGLYTQKSPSLVSPAYNIFEVNDKEELLPEFLFMFFKRKEMDRLGAFMSDSSVRANLDWERFGEIKIPLPPIDVQRSLASLFLCMEEAKNIAKESHELMKSLCPALVQKAAQSA